MYKYSLIIRFLYIRYQCYGIADKINNFNQISKEKTQKSDPLSWIAFIYRFWGIFFSLLEGDFTLFQELLCKFVIGLVRNLFHQLAADHFSVLIDHYKRTGIEIFKRTVFQAYAIFIAEIGTESWCCHHIINAIHSAETRCGKWKVHWDAEHNSIGKLRRLWIKSSHRRCAYVSVKAWEDIEHNPLPFEIFKLYLWKILSYEGEILCFLSGFRQFSGYLKCHSVEIYFLHDL